VCSHKSPTQNEKLRSEFITEFTRYEDSADPSQCLVDSTDGQFAISKLQVGEAKHWH